MSDPREIEAKFDVDEPGRERLLTVDSVGRFSVLERRNAAQDDIYFDTDDAQLALSGSTLRVRRTEKGSRMTFKGRRESVALADEAHIATRLEDEVPLDLAQAASVRIDAPLPELDGISPLARARDIIGRNELRPVARLRNSRTTLLLGADDGATLELAVDDCVGTRLSDGRETRFKEVELETKTADRAALLEASDALRTIAPSLRPSHQAKLGRTLG
jgi:inorganic triphosphatase YgiF